MGKRLLAVIFCILFFATVAIGADWSKGSGAKSASAVISTKGGVLRQIIITTDGSDAVTFDLYDNASAASGTKMIPTWTVTTSSTSRIQSLVIDNARYGSGLYANVVCSGTVSYVVIYRDDN